MATAVAQPCGPGSSAFAACPTPIEDQRPPNPISSPAN
jgi:hypothetical protein